MDIASLLATLAVVGAPAPAESAIKPAPAPAQVKPLDAAVLDDLRGGDGVNAVITDQTLNAVNTGNAVNGQTIGSGAISIGQDAFAGFAGIGNFAINSGHNNNLQANISVSINFAPPAGAP